MKVLSNLSIRAKFLLLPVAAAVLMIALGGIFVNALSSEERLLNQIADEDVQKMRELSRLFSEFSTNHVKFINLLASSLKLETDEGELYARGREHILTVQRISAALSRVEIDYPLNATQQQFSDILRDHLVNYHNQMGNTILMSSVEIHLITQLMLMANEAYDSANTEFLRYIDAVQESARVSVDQAQATLLGSKTQYFLVLGMTVFFILFVSVLLSTLFAGDLKSIIQLLTKLSHGDTDVSVPTKQRRDEFGAVHEALDIFKHALIRRNEIERDLKNEIDERVHAENSLRISEERFRALFEDNPLMLITLDEAGKVLTINKRGEAQLGYTQAELSGRSVQDMVMSEDAETLGNMIQHCLNAPETRHQYTLRKRNKQGNVLWFRETAKMIRDDDLSFILLAAEDVTETRVLSEKLSYQATHDGLTGLVNRWEFENRLVRILNSAREDQSEHVLCFLDLDQFKIINDTCGHSAGDELLKQLGIVLQQQIRSRDTLARLGGDEFGVLLEHCALSAGWRTARNLLKAVDEFRFAWGDRQFRIGVSIGIISIDATCEDIAEVMAGADAACYAAKEQGRNRVHVFTTNDQQLAQRRGEMQWASRIPDALENDLFELFHQEIVPLDNTVQSGHFVELLIRMKGADGGWIMPGQFLPAAERYNLAPDLDRWVVRHALNALRDLEQRQIAVHHYGINLSGNSLGNEEFLDFVQAEISASGVNPSSICFEITETSAISNINSAQHFIRQLKRRGVCFALDDFGTGLSSFAYLRELPVDYLKIDGLFVRDIARDPIQFAMVKSINDIGHVLGMKTIAEFVETEAILVKLQQIKVDFCQGYYFGKPRPAAEFFKQTPARRVSGEKL